MVDATIVVTVEWTFATEALLDAWLTVQADRGFVPGQTPYPDPSVSDFTVDRLNLLAWYTQTSESDQDTWS